MVPAKEPSNSFPTTFTHGDKQSAMVFRTANRKQGDMESIFSCLRNLSACLQQVLRTGEDP